MRKLLVSVALAVVMTAGACGIRSEAQAPPAPSPSAGRWALVKHVHGTPFVNYDQELFIYPTANDCWYALPYYKGDWFTTYTCEPR